MLTADIRAAFETERGHVMSIEGVNRLAQSAAMADPGATQARPSIAITDARRFLATPELATEAFGPFALVILADSVEEMVACARALEGQLTATLHATAADLAQAARRCWTRSNTAPGDSSSTGFPRGWKSHRP